MLAGMRSLALLVVLAASLISGAASASAAPPTIKHVWIVVLENKNYDHTFGASPGSAYLAQTLPAQGQLLTQYYGTGHNSLDNYITMISGQPPAPQPQADCPTFSDFVPTAEPGWPDANGVEKGDGCVYPARALTIADQLEAKGLTWKGYMEDMGKASASAPLTTCDHPAIGAGDPTLGARADDQYAVKHNPFVYFHSIIDRQAACDANVVDLSQLDTDLASASTTPSYSFITPDLCSDGHDGSCADGGPGGYTGINNWLSTWIPKITGSPAYADGGLLIVTFDEAEGGSDGSSCCGEPTGPNTTSPGGGGRPGGGRTGSVLLSPAIMAGTKNDTPYNHYSLLRSTEDFFGLAHLGYAAQDGLQPFGDEVFQAKPAPYDRDGDGKPDSTDACPDVAAVNADGCPTPTDIDGDGVPDSTDACPMQVGVAPSGCPAPVDLNGPKPAIKITGVPKKCVRRAFTAKLKVVAKRLHVASAYVDGRRIKSSKAHKFTVKVKTAKLANGKHRLKVLAKDKIARMGSKTVKFRVCR
jgi:hypothetical protein